MIETNGPSWAEQRAYADRLRRELPTALSYHIVTLGCQMNVRDSETLAGMLEAMGMRMVQAREEADVILYNTCCIRENAENKALGNVIWLKELKALKPALVIGVGGCMAQEAGMAERIRAQYPFVDLVFGTHNAHRLPELMYGVLMEKRRMIEVWDADGDVREDLPVRRASPFSAYINVMYGCDNFCSYCIVPYVRGRERSRRMEDVLAEADALVRQGVREITLLGQNVNSYMGGGASFAELLRRLDGLGVPRIRFMTSHPKDLSDELIACFGELAHLAGHLHLPVQAGSDRVLAAMNRRYTRARYLDLVRRLRAARPDIGLTTDFIVGFPGETLAEFEETLSLAEEVRFDAAFTFLYSPRPGTAAAKLPDEVAAAEKSARLSRLIARQQEITREICLAQIGKVERVLVEGESARDPRQVCGKTGRGQMVNFPGNVRWAGDFARVRIDGAGKSTLRGTRIEQETDGGSMS